VLRDELDAGEEPQSPRNAETRYFQTLERLLTIASPELRPALDQASLLVAEALDADKVDIFLYETDNDSLVALGTSDTPTGHKQHQLGLDRFPRSNGGPVVDVFVSGQAYWTGQADQDPSQPRGVVESLGIRSQIDVPLTVDGEPRGVLSACSIRSNHFDAADEHFLQSVSQWIGLITHRAELVEQSASEAVSRGRREAGEELARITRRQQEVAACVAEGLSNEEIAERLVLTPGTVANHLQQILNRLGLRNRTQLATWAVEHGLYRSTWDEAAEA